MKYPVAPNEAKNAKEKAAWMNGIGRISMKMIVKSNPTEQPINKIMPKYCRNLMNFIYMSPNCFRLREVLMPMIFRELSIAFCEVFNRRMFVGLPMPINSDAVRMGQRFLWLASPVFLNDDRVNPNPSNSTSWQK